MQPMELSDRFGRTLRKLRISVTDRCNFRCLYCLPHEPSWLPRDQILSFEEIVRVAALLLRHGVRKLRLTGGEPLLRRDIDRLVAQLSRLQGLTTLSMTTNGYHLPEQAAALRRAGLQGLTVSIDTLEPREFAQLVRRDALERVLAGIEEALRVGFSPIKLNVVPIRGRNEDAIADFVELARSGPYVVRFIEFMPLDSGSQWSPEQVVSADEILERVRAIAPLSPLDDQDPSDPARRYRFDDGRGEVGIIASVSRPFCQRCDRIRLTADGKILNCLFGKVEYDLRSLLRSGAADEALLAELRRAVGEKQAGHLINQPGFEKPRRPMAAIGG